MPDQTIIDDPDYRDKLIDLITRCYDMDPAQYRRELHQLLRSKTAEGRRA